MSEDVQSPPYPPPGVTLLGLFANLKSARDWVMAQRDGLNKTLGQELIPIVRKPPAKEAYAVLSVQILYSHLVFLRRAREEWDHLIRTYEDAWDCPPAVRARAILVQTAAVFLNSAFVPYEQREANQTRDADRMARMFDSVMAALFKLEEPQQPRE